MVGRQPLLASAGQGTAGDEAMDMEMGPSLLVPGVQHHSNAKSAAQVIAAKLQQGLDLMTQWCAACKVAIWCYCLMPNHVHLIAVPDREPGQCNQRPAGSMSSAFSTHRTR